MADYRFDQLATERVEWTSSKGDALAVVVELTQEMTDYFGTGDFKPARNGLRITINSYINGKCTSPSGTWLKAAPAGSPTEAVGLVGNILLRADKKQAVEAATAAVESHPAYVELQARKAAGDAADREYEAHHAAVEKMMTLGGKTY